MALHVRELESNITSMHLQLAGFFDTFPVVLPTRPALSFGPCPQKIFPGLGEDAPRCFKLVDIYRLS